MLDDQSDSVLSSFKLRGSFQNLQYPLRKTNNGQFALSYITPTFWDKTPETLKSTKNLNTFKHNLKKHFLNELKNYSVSTYFHFQL